MPDYKAMYFDLLNDFSQAAEVINRIKNKSLRKYIDASDIKTANVEIYGSHEKNEKTPEQT